MFAWRQKRGIHFLQQRPGGTEFIFSKKLLPFDCIPLRLSGYSLSVFSQTSKPIPCITVIFAP